MASISIPAASVPPPPPARSPLRPTPISRTPTSAASFANQQDSKRNSFPSLSSMLDALTPVTVSLATDDSKSHKTMSSSSSSLPYTPIKPAPMTKRYHALHELLSSERAYASDLALIREVHIPLALGQSIPFSPATPPASNSNSSGSSARTLSTASDSSTGSTSTLGPPMTFEDTKVIFSNIAELARFSDMFSDELEEALGNVLPGGVGEDRVGELFLKIIPDLEPPYKYYITRHSSALNHLSSLPQTPAFTAYLAQTQSYASAMSHAWDLSSLLIKPVQRLLKYSLLLQAILDETPDGHGDKDNLRLAKLKMEEVARSVNEGRRRVEVVKEVLTAASRKNSKSGSGSADGAGGGSNSNGNSSKDGSPLKKRSLNVGLAASVNLTKVKSVTRTLKAKDLNEEVAKVEELHAELKLIQKHAQDWAKSVVDWSKSMHTVVVHLRAWALSFGNVIGLSLRDDDGEGGFESEAFEAFLAVVNTGLMPLAMELENKIRITLLNPVAKLLTTMGEPEKLLSSMYEQEPYHYHLLNMPISHKDKSAGKMAPALLEASTNYLALRGQLCAELPTYIKLMRKGLGAAVVQLAAIQTEFWGNVRDKWGDLWDMLKVEGEMNAGAQETMNVWWMRWEEVDRLMKDLNIVTPVSYQVSVLQSSRSAPASSTIDISLPRKPSTSASGVLGMLGALEPSHSHSTMSLQVSSPLPLSGNYSRNRLRGASDVSTTARPRPRRYSSSESLRSRFSGKSSGGGKSGTSGKTTSKRPGTSSGINASSSQRHLDEFGDYVSVSAIPISPNTAGVTYKTVPRTKSMPLPPGAGPSTAPSSMMSSSSARMLGGTYDGTVYDDKDRVGRKASIRKKFAGTLQRRRSPSSGNGSLSVPPSPSYSDAPPPSPIPPVPLYSNAQRTSWADARVKYRCEVIHTCRPPGPVSYYSFPFFTLEVGDKLEVLREAGHPNVHPKLPLQVDDGEDCLLLVRDSNRNVGWALASFLIPLDVPNAR